MTPNQKQHRFFFSRLISSEPPHSGWVFGVLFLGVLAISTSSILIRLTTVSAEQSGVGFSLMIAASRLILASLLLAPGWSKMEWKSLGAGACQYAVGAGVCLALHFATWTTSLSYTSIAASTTLVTTNPIWMAIISWLWFREKLTRLTWVGIIVALSGGVIIALGDLSNPTRGSQPLLGNFLALLGAWVICGYFLLGKEAQKRHLNLRSYITIAYTVAALLLLPLPWFWGIGYGNYPAQVYGYLLLMALLPQLVGHTSLNWAVRWIAPTFVTLFVLFEPVAASGLAYLILGEIPGQIIILGAMIVLMGVALAVAGSRKSELNDQ